MIVKSNLFKPDRKRMLLNLLYLDLKNLLLGSISIGIVLPLFIDLKDIGAIFLIVLLIGFFIDFTNKLRFLSNSKNKNLNIPYYYIFTDSKFKVVWNNGIVAEYPWSMVDEFKYSKKKIKLYVQDNLFRIPANIFESSVDKENAYSLIQEQLKSTKSEEKMKIETKEVIINLDNLSLTYFVRKNIFKLVMNLLIFLVIVGIEVNDIDDFLLEIAISSLWVFVVFILWEQRKLKKIKKETKNNKYYYIITGQ
ncbi:hypothetical protein [Orenia marismortui]|uniref:YcxB-like protein n=1 Tax=Orenia marismortui TaxID=46469 RepID=A0A4R8HAE1_9FIRM|nr:hypothetical protein [Orenia marismortui]TDX53263.1 hypothetical protein C7959_103115 [Orenia marismortui]